MSEWIGFTDRVLSEGNRAAWMWLEGRTPTWGEYARGVTDPTRIGFIEENVYGSLGTGLKGFGNGGAQAVQSTLTLGQHDGWRPFEVTTDDLRRGYGGSELVGRLTFELVIGLGTGGLAKAPQGVGYLGKAAQAAVVWDRLGSGVSVARGTWGIGYEDGLTWENSAQVLGGAAGFTPGSLAARLTTGNPARGFGVYDDLVESWYQFPAPARASAAEDLVIDAYGRLSLRSDLPGQAHHLNQTAAFRDVIPKAQGVSIKLEGDILVDAGAPHTRAHASLEAFWNQFRGTEIRPTNLQYTQALQQSLRAAGLPEPQVQQAVRAAIQERVRYGLLGGSPVPRVPSPIHALAQ